MPPKVPKSLVRALIDSLDDNRLIFKTLVDARKGQQALSKIVGKHLDDGAESLDDLVRAKQNAGIGKGDELGHSYLTNKLQNEALSTSTNNLRRLEDFLKKNPELSDDEAKLLRDAYTEQKFINDNIGEKGLLDFDSKKSPLASVQKTPENWAKEVYPNKPYKQGVDAFEEGKTYSITPNKNNYEELSSYIDKPKPSIQRKPEVSTPKTLKELFGNQRD